MKGKTVVITGGTSGIGQVAAENPPPACARAWSSTPAIPPEARPP